MIKDVPPKRRALVLFSLLACLTCNKSDVYAEEQAKEEKQKKRIAIIGGGISGTFTAKYLSEYNVASSLLCQLDEVTLFDEDYSIRKSSNNDRQGGRISSLNIPLDSKDNSNNEVVTVELGASIVYSGNKLVKDMVEADSNLEMNFPQSSSPSSPKENTASKDEPNGFGIWNGESFSLLTSQYSSSPFMKKMALLYRYNFDLLRLDKAVTQAVSSFDYLYEILNDTNDSRSFMSSPNELWSAVGLLTASMVSFNVFLDSLGITKDVLPSWRKKLGQGVLRDELLTGANLSNYNQNNDEMNGLAGLVSFVPTKGELFFIKGGNDQIPKSAWKQATELHASVCSDKGDGNKRTFDYVKKQVTKVILSQPDNNNDASSFDLWSDTQHLGEYDIVILAAPLSTCEISFLLQSHMDESVLTPLPLNGGLLRTRNTNANEHLHKIPSLPESATRKYRQTITTVVSSGEYQSEYFHFSSEQTALPRSVYFTTSGEESLGISSITQVKGGIFKMFSEHPLSMETLRKVFGKNVNIEHVKVWGGEHGGAYPSFQGGGKDTNVPFCLHSNKNNNSKDGSGGALFYVNAMEINVAAMEISAIGAKAVAKLVAKRMGLAVPRDKGNVGEEL